MGAVVGVLASLWMTRLLESLLVDIPTTDPVAFAVATVVLMVATGAAAFVPPRRASLVDPLIALRSL